MKKVVLMISTSVVACVNVGVGSVVAAVVLFSIVAVVVVTVLVV